MSNESTILSENFDTTSNIHVENININKPFMTFKWFNLMNLKLSQVI